MFNVLTPQFCSDMEALGAALIAVLKAPEDNDLAEQEILAGQINGLYDRAVKELAIAAARQEPLSIEERITLALRDGMLLGVVERCKKIIESVSTDVAPAVH